jgi:predicted Holliday junction resolvase-like endonuclease
MEVLLIFIGIVTFIVGIILGRIIKDIEWRIKLPKLKKDSLNRSRAVLKGQISEQLAPFLPEFPYKPSECKFLGKPIDFIVFKGLDNQEIEEIVFVEVKTGKSKLNKTEKGLKDAINNKDVKWEEYRI